MHSSVTVADRALNHAEPAIDGHKLTSVCMLCLSVQSSYDNIMVSIPITLHSGTVKLFLVSYTNFCFTWNISKA